MSRIDSKDHITSDSDISLNGFSARIIRLSERVIVLEGWRCVLTALFAGALSALSLAPFHLSPVLLFTFPVLIWLLDGAVAPAGASGFTGFFKRFWPAFKIGWLFGFGHFLASFWWVGKAFLVDAEEFIYLLPVAVLALPAGLALFWGFATALARIAWGDGWVRIAALACTFTLAEWLRGTILTGLPWNNPGYGAMPVPLLMQSAGLIGLYGMTFFTVLVASTPGIFVQGQKRFAPMITVAVALIIAHGAYGLFALSKASNSVDEKIVLRLVQPAIDQSEKWDVGNEPEIMGRYFELSNKNLGPQAAGIGSFTHVIWPESAFPFILTRRRDQLTAIANLLPPKTTLITGAMRLEESTLEGEPPKVFNALYAINGDGEIVAAYDKVQLVPFGEFLPFQETLEDLGLRQLTNLRGGFAHGFKRQVMSIPGTPDFLPLICYEIIFSGAVQGEGKRPKWIVNLTNDAWFGITSGPYQHAHQAQVRAVEEGLPVVRAANNGISFVTDAHGRIVQSLGLGQRGVVDAKLPVAGPVTLFSRIGNMPFLIFVCVIFLILVGVRSRNTNRL